MPVPYSLFCTLLLLLSLCNFPVFSATYYVDIDSTGGPCDDDSSGTSLETPFCSLEHSARQLGPGDTLFIRGGTYPQRLRIRAENAGTETERINIQPYNDEYVLITGGRDQYICVSLFSSYVTIRDLHLRNDLSGNHDGYRAVDLRGHHNEVFGLEVWQDLTPLQQYDRGIRTAGIIIDAGNFDRVENCEVRNMRTGIGISRNGANVPTFNIVKNSLVSSTWGNCFEITSTLDVLSGNVIEGNLCEGSLISDGAQSNANFDLEDTDPDAYAADISAMGYIIRGNIFRYFAENCIDIKGSSHFVIEENICYGGAGNNDGYYADLDNDRGGGVGGFMHGSGQSSWQVIIRNNVLYDNKGAISIYLDWVAYNNIIWNNNRDYEGPNSVTTEKVLIGITANQNGNAVKNNLIGESFSYDFLQKEKGGDHTLDADYNVYYNTKITQNFMRREPSDGTFYTLDEWKQYLLTRPDLRGNEEHSFSDSPEFTNAPSDAWGDHTKYDFTLLPSSPLWNAGGPLTVAVGSGSGTSLTVEQASYFFDGYGIDGEGDSIVVGSNSPVRVVSVNYGSNVIQLESSITWSDGDWVNLPYTGPAPDIGNNIWPGMQDNHVYWDVSDYRAPSSPWVVTAAAVGSAVGILFLAVAIVIILIFVLCCKNRETKAP